MRASKISFHDLSYNPDFILSQDDRNPDFWDFPEKYIFHYSFGPQDISRKLNRVGAVHFCAVIAQINRINASKNRLEISKRVLKFQGDF